MNLSEAFTQIGQWFAEHALRLLTPGGTTGQVLTKVDGTDYNVSWEDPAGGGGSVTVAGDNTIYDPIGGPFTGPHSESVSTIAFPAAYFLNFLSPGQVAVGPPTPTEITNVLFSTGTIDGSTNGHFHIVNDTAAATSAITVDCDFSTGIKKNVINKLVNNHAGPVEVSFINSILITSKNLTTDGLGNPMVKVDPAQGGLIYFMFDDATFTLFIWGDTVP